MTETSPLPTTLPVYPPSLLSQFIPPTIKMLVIFPSRYLWQISIYRALNMPRYEIPSQKSTSLLALQCTIINVLCGRLNSRLLYKMTSMLFYTGIHSQKQSIFALPCSS